MRTPLRQLGLAVCALIGAFGLAAAAPARAQDAGTPAAHRHAPSGKVAVVVAGDPDAQLRAQAAAVQQSVQHAGIETPADAALVHALWGAAPAAPNDGLEEARAERRRLGWGEKRDVPVLGRIGRMTGASVVLVVRRETEGPELVGFDVPDGAFFEGALPLPGAPRAVASFAVARLRATAIGPASVAPARAAAEGAAPASAKPAKALKTKPKAKHEKRWIAKNWPYVVAGVLLAGTVAYFVARRHRTQSTTPVLRFQLGGNP